MGSPPLVPVPDGPRRHLTLAQPVVQSARSAVLGETPGDTTLESTDTIVQ
jgi:hypothetical protein